MEKNKTVVRADPVTPPVVDDEARQAAKDAAKAAKDAANAAKEAKQKAEAAQAEITAMKTSLNSWYEHFTYGGSYPCVSKL